MTPSDLFPSERIADFITLSVYAFTFLFVFVATFLNARKRRMRFDALSRTLTARELVLFLAYALGAANVFVDGIRPDWLRWSMRTIGILCNVALVLYIVLDERPEGRMRRWIKRHLPARIGT